MIGAVCSGFHRAVDVPCCNTPDHAVSTTDSWQRTITAGSEEATSTALSKIESNVAPGLAAADQQIATRRRFDWVWPKGWSGWLAGKAVHRDRPSVIVSTLCMVHNKFGQYYLSSITPFHKVGLRRLMANALAAQRL